MNSTNLPNISLPSNSDHREACELEDLVRKVNAKSDFLEKVFGTLIATNHEHMRLSDPIMLALQNPEIYHSLNYLFETPLHSYNCLNNAFQYLPFDEMAWHKTTPLVDIIRVFSEVKDSLLSAHLSAVKCIS
jgi:hypothetical protein